MFSLKRNVFFSEDRGFLFAFCFLVVASVSGVDGVEPLTTSDVDPVVAGVDFNATWGAGDTVCVGLFGICASIPSVAFGAGVWFDSVFSAGFEPRRRLPNHPPPWTVPCHSTMFGRIWDDVMLTRSTQVDFS